jgi:hypothetical protein
MVKNQQQNSAWCRLKNELQALILRQHLQKRNSKAGGISPDAITVGGETQNQHEK